MKLEYWLPYGAIDWKSWKDDDIERAAAEIIRELPDEARRQLNILDLGLGIGILELPLLAQVQRQLQCPLTIVGIDQSWKALEVTRRLLAVNGLGDELPTATETFLRCMKKYWPDDKETKETAGWFVDPETGLSYCSGKGLCASHGEVTYLLIQTDLDFLDQSSKSGAAVMPFVDDAGEELTKESGSAWRSLPSNWPADLAMLLADKTVRPNGSAIPQQFDILITSLALMHMKWWRRTLWNGLQLLRSGGLFLHSKLGGDELIFEGGGAPIHKATCTAEEVFGELFEAETVKEFMRRSPRYYTATAPIELYDFLYHILGQGAKPEAGSPHYYVPNLVRKKHYSALLDTAGYSLLHSIKGRMKHVYEEICCKVVDKYLQDGQENDRRALLSKVTWDAYRVKNPNSLRPWARLFAPKRPFSGKAHTTLSGKMEYYQLHTAIHWGLSYDFTGNPGEDRRGYALAKILETGGLLHPDALGGDLSLQDSFGKLRFEGFINPHWLLRPNDCSDSAKTAHVFIESLRQYVSMIQQWKYSNTKTLVEVFGRQLNAPCVFTFRKAKEPQLSIERCSGFYEIRVSLPEESPPAVVSLESATRPWAPASHQAARDPALRPFTFPLGGTEQTSYAMSNTMDVSAERLLQQLCAYCSQTSSLEQRAEILQHFLSGQENLDFARSACCLHLVPGWTTWAIFPGWFTAESGSLNADESILVAYASDLNERDLAHEYEKSRVLFSKLGMSRAFRSGESDAFDKMRRAFGHELSKVYSGAVRALRASSHRSDGVWIFASRVAEAALRYGLLWAKSTDLSLLPDGAYTVTNGKGNEWSKYAHAVAMTSWQTFLGANLVFVDGAKIAMDPALIERVNVLWETKHLATLIRVEGMWRFLPKTMSGHRLDSDGFVADLFLWFMIGLTNAWKHLVFSQHGDPSGRELDFETRLAATEQFVIGTHAVVCLRAELQDGQTVLSIENTYKGRNLTPSRTGKSALALELASDEIRKFLRKDALQKDRFEGVAQDQLWYTKICLPDEILQSGMN